MSLTDRSDEADDDLNHSEPAFPLEYGTTKSFLARWLVRVGEHPVPRDAELLRL